MNRLLVTPTAGHQVDQNFRPVDQNALGLQYPLSGDKGTDAADPLAGPIVGRKLSKSWVVIKNGSSPDIDTVDTTCVPYMAPRSMPSESIQDRLALLQAYGGCDMAGIKWYEPCLSRSGRCKISSAVALRAVYPHAFRYRDASCQSTRDGHVN
ncbi:MAG: hypothetical protein U0930_02180 [Pirellulales bacterium]